MPSNITNRIVTEAGIPRLFPVLAHELSGSDFHSLLLEVYRSRAKTISEANVLERAHRDALVAASTVDARLLHGFDRAAFAAAPDFEAVDLSPVCALGTQNVLGHVDQNNVVSTTRNAEVLGDSTPALAVECARRRKQRAPHDLQFVVRLCATHRVVRMQPLDFPGFTPHFRLFGLVSAGRDQGSSTFEIQQLREHLGFYLKLFRGLNTEGFRLADPLIELSDLTMTEALLADFGVSREDLHGAVRAHTPGSSQRFLLERGIQLPADILDPGVELEDLARQHRLEWQLARLSLLKQRVVDPLTAEYPEASFRFNLARLEGLGYYTGLCLRISPVAPNGARYPIADGGFTDWTARLLQNKKERLLTSGIGSEFVCRCYHLAIRED